MDSSRGKTLSKIRHLGANIRDGGVHFSVWVPNARSVTIAYTNGADSWAESGPLGREGNGVHAGFVANAGPGTRYLVKLDGGDGYPDPWSRFQPDGPHGPSEVIDPDAYLWTDAEWGGLTSTGLVIYECHVGTYTPDGTYAALIEQLPELKALGVTAVELMPVAQCPGRWN